MRRFTYILIIGLLLLSACKKMSPEDTLLVYLDAQYVNLNQDKLNELRAPCYKENEELDYFFDYQQLPALSDVSDIYEFEILSTSYKHDSVFIKVNQIEPSLDNILSSTIKFNDIISIVSFNDEERNQFLNKRIEDAMKEQTTITSISRIVEYCLILHKGIYKIRYAK